MMPITPDCQLIPTHQITVDRAARQRKEIETAGLEKSIAQRGLINPIVISRELVLIAGERRLTACRNLGHRTIFARFVDSLSPQEAQLLELEENIHREDLEWQDIARAVAGIHSLHRSIDPDWTQADTAEACSMSAGNVSMYLRIMAEMGTSERIANAGTVREAHNVILRKEARAAGDALEELLAPPPTQGAVVAPLALSAGLPSPAPSPYQPPPVRPGPRAVEQCILNESFLDWAPKYTGPKFNLIHCDFPYGIEVFAGPRGRGSELAAGYADGAGVYFRLLECLCKNLDSIMSLSAHMMFWYSEEHGEATRKIFQTLAPSLKVHKYPLIWVKSNNDGIAADARRTPRHVYETALFISRGSRQIVQIKADAYSSPTDHKLHPSTKPVPMLKHFMTMMVDEYTSLLDPTCGSGAALRAGEDLGAREILGLEIDEQYVIPARKVLGSARVLREASKGL